MKKIIFDEEELFAIAVFSPDTRDQTIAAMSEALQELEDDPEMKALLVSAREKLLLTTDDEFKKLDVEAYREELEQDDEEEEEEEEETVT